MKSYLRPQRFSQIMDTDAEEYWTDYYEIIKDGEPRKTCVIALDNFHKVKSNTDLLAVDLGCGEGRDTRAMLARGWKVHAIDATTSGIEMLEKSIPSGARDRLTTSVMKFEEIVIPDAAYINASYSLPFCNPNNFKELMGKVDRALSKGGRFSGQLFGVNDEWKERTEMTFLTLEQVEKYFANYEFELFNEEEGQGNVASGASKYWHAFHIVARKL